MEESPLPANSGATKDEVDINVAQRPRTADYLLDGDGNFAVDREAVDYITSAIPGGIEAARAMARAGEAFLVRTVRYLAEEAGLRQFVDTRARMPSHIPVHQVAQQVAPSSRVVYVVDDPVVMAHAHQLLRSTPEGATTYVQGDLSDPECILHEAARTLDLSRPIALVCRGNLADFTDDEAAQGVVDRLLEPVVSGSHLVVSHLASDIHPETFAEAKRRHSELIGRRVLRERVSRSRAQVSHLFDGLELVDPGVVPENRWRPDGTEPASAEELVVPLYGAVGRKP